MIDSIRKALEVALEALESAKGNINPERGFSDEVEAELAAAIEQAQAALAKLPAAECVVFPVEPSVALLTTMSVALGIQPLGDGSDGSYPITGAQSTVRQCYDALLGALRQAN